MTVMHLPVKLEFDWTKRFRVRVQKRKCGQTDGWTEKWTKNGQENGQKNRRNFPNFERNLAMMVIYLPVKFEFDWTNRFRVRVRKRKCGLTEGWTDEQTKNRKRTDGITPMAAYNTGRLFLAFGGTGCTDR